MYQLDRIKAAQNLRGFSHSKTAEALNIPLATFKKYLSGERTLPHDFWKKASQLLMSLSLISMLKPQQILICPRLILGLEQGLKLPIQML